MVGRFVCSLAGRDKGYWMVVVKEENGFYYVADGKERPLEHPKPKNPKHLFCSEERTLAINYSTNKLLRKTLAVFREREEQNV